MIRVVKEFRKRGREGRGERERERERYEVTERWRKLRNEELHSFYLHQTLTRRGCHEIHVTIWNFSKWQWMQVIRRGTGGGV
jgi:hypothetical protein